MFVRDDGNGNPDYSRGASKARQKDTDHEITEQQFEAKKADIEATLQPDPVAAYEALAASGADPLSLYSKVLGIASRANTSVSADVAISVNTQATLLAANLTLGRWRPGIIAGTNAVLLNLQATLNGAGMALTADNIQWVNDWIDQHGLGLDHLS